MAIKRWEFPKGDKSNVDILAQECGISTFVAEILTNRGILTSRQAFELLSDEIAFESPYNIVDMDKAVDRIRLALDSNESIVIYGDYDCDGVTSTAVLYSYLSFLGANVSTYIPSRFEEGYGMNENAVRKLADEGTSLIITVDNGVSAHREVDIANELGMTVIITDHHQVSDVLPNAYAVVNPHRKDCTSDFKLLAGVGVVFKLITALEEGDYMSTLEQFADIVTIGTIADLVPLVSENRAIVQYGLRMLSITENLGLRALMEVSKINIEEIDSIKVAFGIAPRINASGRMEDANIALDLLLCDDYDKALELATKLDELNTQRKEKEAQIALQIEDKIMKNKNSLNDRVLTYYDESWHHGIIGIVSSRVLEKYGKPNLLMACHDGVLVGSARSVKGFSLYKALCSCDENLIKYGGHSLAAGFSLNENDFDDFKENLENYAKENNMVMPTYTYKIDKEILPSELNVENIKSVEILKPFGSENPQPLYLIRNALIDNISAISEGKHIRLKLKYENINVSATMFRTTLEEFVYNKGDRVDLLLDLSTNIFNDVEYLSAVIKDIRPSGFNQNLFFNGKAYYEMFCRNEKLSQGVIKKMTPTRDEIAYIYRFIKKIGCFNSDIDNLYHRVYNKDLNYCKYRLIMDILNQANLITIGNMLNVISVNDVDGKVDIENTKTMKKLKNI